MGVVRFAERLLGHAGRTAVDRALAHFYDSVLCSIDRGNGCRCTGGHAPVERPRAPVPDRDRPEADVGGDPEGRYMPTDGTKVHRGLELHREHVQAIFG